MRKITYKLPDSTYGKIIFPFSHERKFYVLNNPEENFKSLDSICRRNKVKISVIIKFLESIRDSANDAIPKHIPKETPSLVYLQAMKMLYFSSICFCVFFFLVFFQTYYYCDVNMIDIALPFGYLGLGVCAVVIFNRGRYRFSIPWFGKEKNPFLNSYHRNKVFELINSTNRRLKGLKLNLGPEGKWIELEEIE